MLNDDHLNAAIDVGTNTCKLLIGKCTSDLGVSHVDFVIRRTRLGEDSFADHLLKPAPIARTVDALKEFVVRTAAFGVQTVRAVSTHALRQATNSAIVLDQIRQATGLNVEIISGAAEAELTLSGAISDFSEQSGILAINSGGGSTEYATRIGSTTLLEHLDVGALSLTNTHLKHDPPSDAEQTALIEDIVNHLGRLRMLHDVRRELREVVAVGGSAVTLAWLAQRNADRDLKSAHLFRLTNDDLRQLLNTVSALTTAERARLAGMDPGRADTILAGAMIYAQSLAYFERTSIVVSTRSIADGILWKLSGRP